MDNGKCATTFVTLALLVCPNGADALSRAVRQEIFRGPRPPEARWPKHEEVANATFHAGRDSIRGRGSVQGRRGFAEGRRGSVLARRGSTEGRSSILPPQVQRPPNPEEAISNARARVVKLEAALAAVGSWTPFIPSSAMLLKQAQSKPESDQCRSASKGPRCSSNGQRKGFPRLERRVRRTKQNLQRRRFSNARKMTTSKMARGGSMPFFRKQIRLHSRPGHHLPVPAGSAQTTKRSSESNNNSSINVKSSIKSSTNNNENSKSSSRHTKAQVIDVSSWNFGGVF